MIGMELPFLPSMCRSISRSPMAIFLVLFIAFTSTRTSSGLPHKLSEEKGNLRNRWTIDDCFLGGRGKYDVTFVVDAATSRETFRNIQRFINDVTRRLRHARSGAKIGIITFGTRLQSIVIKKHWRHQAELRDKIYALKPLIQHRRNIGRALKAVSQTIIPGSEESNIIVLLAGGESFDPVLRASRIIQKTDARIVTLGYNNANVSQLRWTVSRPIKENLFLFDDSEDLLIATEAILSIICEEELNGKPLKLKFKKQAAYGNKAVHLLGQRSIVSSAESINIRWGGHRNPQMMSYKITWMPNDGKMETMVNETMTRIILTNLKPATLYKIQVAKIARKSHGRPLTIIAATAPLPVKNLTAKLEYLEPCTLQKQLQVKSEPRASRLVRLTKRSTSRYLTNMKPGTNYIVTVVSRGPKLHSSKPENITIVIPPSDPIRLDTVVINSSTVAIRWLVPREAVFDSFIIEIVSAFGKTSIRVVAPEEPTNTSPTQRRLFYTFIVGDLRPDTEYRVTVFTESLNVASRGEKTEQFSTKFSTDTFTVPFLIISGGDGIYAATAKRGHLGTESVQRLYPVVGGVVNSVYHSRWIPTRQFSHFQSGSYEWQKMLIWIERYTRDIKVTDLTSQSRTVTLVSGLLQPVGLMIDPYGENVYWTDIGSRAIGVASISADLGRSSYRVNRKLITGDLVSPVSLAMDVVNRHLFWGDLRGTIERSDMDGNHRTVLLRRPTLRPYSVVYCSESKRLYWLDDSTGDLETMMSSGEELRTVYERAHTPLAKVSTLVIADGSFYLYDVQGNGIDMFQKPNGTGEYIQYTSVYPNSNVPSITSMTSFDSFTLEKGNFIRFSYEDSLLSLMVDPDKLHFPCDHAKSTCVGVCIPVTMDEATCSNDCKPWEILCYRSTGVVCIGQHLTCNGKMDCEHGEDEDLPECEERIEEEYCEYGNMTAYGCRDTGKCIPYEHVCNGFLNCQDGSDEMNCPVQKQSCDFESNSLCLWSQDRESDDFDWTLHYGKTASNETGPLMDHTMRKMNGSYLYMEATPQDDGSKTRLISVVFGKPLCISFFYYMHGATIGALSLIQKDHLNGQEIVLWSKEGDQGVGWKAVKISVDKHQLYTLVIEGIRGRDYRSDIAIDDITVEDGLCPITNECDFHNFDDLMCGYKLGAYWNQVSGPVAAPGSEPVMSRKRKPGMQDLTTILGPDWFYFDYKSDDNPGCNGCNGARLVRDISSLGYSNDGSGIKYAGVVLCNTDRYKIHLSDSLSGPFRNIADGAGKGEDHCEFIGAPDYAVGIGKYKDCEGDVGYVRRRWGETVEVESYGFYRSIYFASDSYECGYRFPQEIIDNDPIKWLKTLPNDYLHLDFLSLRTSGRKSEFFKIPIALVKEEENVAVETPVEEVEANPRMFSFTSKSTQGFEMNQTVIESELPNPPSWCLQFRYYMIGSDMKMLSISVDKNYGVWVKNGDQGSNWKNASVDIPYPAVKYDLMITAERGSGYEGSVGIDDVTIKQEPCHPRLIYNCQFDVPMKEECSFTIFGGQSQQVRLDPLYKRSKFEPNIVLDRSYPGGVITATEIKLSNGTSVTTYPILQSPLLPSLSQFYPVLCLTVNYRQKSVDGQVSVKVRGASSGGVQTVSEHQLPTESSAIRPWLTHIALVTNSLPMVTKEDFYLEFHGLNATWVNQLTLDTVKCSAVIEDLCSNSVKCGNSHCVPPELLCDGINDCGDWTDEIGCPSLCGTVADYFDVTAHFANARKLLKGDTCVHRIHGQPGKQTLLSVGAVKSSLALSSIVMKVYKGFMIRDPGKMSPGSGYFPEGSLVFTTDKFEKATSYLIESYNLTIVMDYSSLSQTPIPMSYEMVEEGHCSLVCPNHHCLFNNRRCDGNPGCSDGSDEKNCTRVVLREGVKILEVKHLDGPYAPICADDITERLADAVCKQLGDLYAERPLNTTALPPSYDEITPHKLLENFEITDNTMLQSFIEATDDEFIVGTANVLDQPKKTARQCTSRETWVPNCISYQCGIRPIDVNPFAPSSPALHPILRIIGGVKSTKGKWPWMASLLLKERDHNCGATLISDRFVVTAAHCFDEHSPELFTVLLGAISIKNYGPQAATYRVKRGIIHSSYNKQADIPDWDIALAETERAVHFTTYISPICLPGGDMDFPSGTSCYIAGFGHTSEGKGSQNTLNEARTPIISHSDCDQNTYKGSITERMLCAGFPSTGGVGICHGDSGGPLMCQQNKASPWYLVGVISWSIGCANKGKPDVFTRILSHVGWLNEQTGFNLTLPEQKPPVLGSCGGTFYGEESGAFASPGWPNNYRNNQDCTYLILADLGQSIHLTFEEFETEKWFDVVEIFSGDTEVSSLINRQRSGTKKPDPMSVRSSALYVIFKSDSDTNERGFLARWQISEEPTTYSGPTHPLQILLRFPHGTAITNLAQPQLGYYFYSEIGPGGWPIYNQYFISKTQRLQKVTNKLEYIPSTGHWTIRPRGNHLPNEKTGFRVACVKPTPDLCQSTWQMWNGSSWINVEVKTSLQIGLTVPLTTTAFGTTSSTSTTSTIQSTSTTTTATTSESTTTITTIDLCHETLTEKEGKITTPGYGSRNYTNSMECRWFINPPKETSEEKRWFLLEIVDFETQEDHDYLQGFSGNTTSGSSLFGLSGIGFHMTGESTPELEISPLSADLETRDEVEPWFSLLGGIGFSFDVPITTLPVTVSNTTSGNIGSPSKPSKIITVLKYEDTQSTGMTLTFESDDLISNKGFLIRYYVLSDMNDSPLTSSKYVTIDVTPSLGFEDSGFVRKKRWTISGAGEDYGTGSGDFVYSAESKDDYDPYYYPYTDFFYKTWTSLIDPACDFTIDFDDIGSKEINYTSHFDPKTRKEAHCVWKIRTGYSWRVLDINLNLDGRKDSTSAYHFQVIDQLDVERFLVDAFPSAPIQKSLSGLNYAEIHFRTSEIGIGFNAALAVYDVGGQGISSSTLPQTSTTLISSVPPSPKSTAEQELQITSNCDDVVENFELSKFYIFSPNFPDPYPGDADCTWVIKAPSQQQIEIVVTNIDIERVSPECDYDNLTIIDGGLNSKPLGVFCGTTLPHRIVSSGSVMVVKFKSDRLVQDKGFRAIVNTIESSPSSKSKKGENNKIMFSCDFDAEHICDFEHDKSDDVDFTWTRHFSVTPSENTGPPHDASESGNGYYLYIEASMPRAQGDRARIISPMIRSSLASPMCLNFAYSMRGLSVGSLVVYISIASDGVILSPEEEVVQHGTMFGRQNLYELRPVVLNFGAGLNQDRMKPTYGSSSRKPDWQQYLLWSRTGEQNDDDKPWLTAQVTFTPNNHFQLMFDALRGTEYQSDIAIDNIIVSKGACEKTSCDEDEIACDGGDNKRAVCISKELKCDGHEDCESGSDELKCTFPLKNTCNSMLLTPNTTEWMICQNVEKCNLRHDNQRLSEIACDGVYDCFGGYDESYCDVINGAEKTTEKKSCGKQKIEDIESVNRSHIHPITSDVFPWVAGLYIRINSDIDLEERNRFLFLCSATFIRDSWLLAPAHCILDPEMKREDLEGLIHNRDTEETGDDHEEEVEVDSETEPLNSQGWNDTPWLADFNPLSEFPNFFQEKDDDLTNEVRTMFEYYIIVRSPVVDHLSESEDMIYKVSKLVPHPNYNILSSLQEEECNITHKIEKEFDDEFEIEFSEDSAKCDIKRINYDLTLIRIEDPSSRKESIIEEELDTNDRITIKSTSEKSGANFACLNQRHLTDVSLSQEHTSDRSSQSNNIFFPPLEKDAYHDDYHKKAICYAVGHAPVKNGAGKQTLTLSRKSVKLANGDVSARNLICGMQYEDKMNPRCAEYFKKELRNDFNPMIISGYDGYNDGSFLYDQGSVLMCKAWDERWYLTGLYSWSNLYRNLQNEKLYEPSDPEAEITGGLLRHGVLIGWPLGLNAYLDITQISGWVEETLQEDCPGEFACYDSTSEHPQKCISNLKLCDGIIDCPFNFLDEVSCASGCTYDPELDSFATYYKNLEGVGISLPGDIVNEYDLKGTNSSVMGSLDEMRNPKSIIISDDDSTLLRNLTVEEDDEKSWSSGTEHRRIRANKVKTEKIKMCIWTIKAPEDKVSVLRILHFHTFAEGNRIQILNGEGRGELLRGNTEEILFTSDPGDTVSIRILPPSGQPYLTEISFFEAEHRTEDIGSCEGRHKCGDGKCVSPHRVCDGLWDCDDKSDERECRSGCGGLSLISGPTSGRITSKNYPLRHSGNGDCEWKFLAESTPDNVNFATINLEFLDFATDEQDILFLFKGAGVRKTEGDLFAIYSGDRGPFNVTIHEKAASIVLRSNDYIGKRRINLRYTVTGSVDDPA